MVAKVEIISKELIKPSFPTPQETKDLKLSFLDQIKPPIYIPLIFIYKNHDTSCFNIDNVKRSQLLKKSLSEALATYYPLAGRITGNLFVDCNDSGALFVAAQVHYRLTEEGIPIQHLNHYLPLEPYNFNGIGSNIPSLAIQFNTFECGGTALGVCISHKVADLMSLAIFMKTWAAKAAGKAEEIVSPSFHLSSQLFPPIDEESPFPRHVQSSNAAKFVTKRFVFDKDKIAVLKAEARSAASGSQVIKDPTRVEAVSAFLWKHFIAISKCKVNGSKAKGMYAGGHSVNLRPRMGLPLERFAFGNLIVITFAILTPEEDQEYHDLVRQMRTAIKNINDDHVNIVRSGLPYLCNKNKGIEQVLRKDISHWLFSSWCRFPLYEVDYGWGKPLSVCTVMPHGHNIVYLMDTRCGEGIEAWVSMLEDEMALLPDELLSLATNNIII